MGIFRFRGRPNSEKGDDKPHASLVCVRLSSVHGHVKLNVFGWPSVEGNVSAWCNYLGTHQGGRVRQTRLGVFNAADDLNYRVGDELLKIHGWTSTV
jgi:hypothetical protein